MTPRGDGLGFEAHQNATRVVKVSEGEKKKKRGEMSQKESREQRTEEGKSTEPRRGNYPARPYGTLNNNEFNLTRGLLSGRKR